VKKAKPAPAAPKKEDAKAEEGAAPKEGDGAAGDAAGSAAADGQANGEAGPNPPAEG